MVQLKKTGFTLLEIIIVIIIVGVLASLALPRFFKLVEYSRSAEALVSLSAVRQSMERCYLQRNTYVGCTPFTSLDLEDPANSPNSHFTYNVPVQTGTTFTVRATRNTRDRGMAGDQIDLALTATSMTKSGTGNFAGIK